MTTHYIVFWKIDAEQTVPFEADIYAPSHAAAREQFAMMFPSDIITKVQKAKVDGWTD